MSRKKLANQTYQKLYNTNIGENSIDPEFDEITKYTIYGETFHQGSLDERRRLLITIVSLATLQTLPQVKNMVDAALHMNVSPLEIREALYQTAPFIGIARCQNAIDCMNDVFISHDIPLPLERLVDDYDGDDRYQIGKDLQFPIYGDNVKNRYASLYEGYSEFVPKMLTEYAFGDFYRRGVLSIKDRELLTLCVLITLDSYQVKPHIIGNLKAGNSKEEILSAIIHIQPYVGTPLSYHALNAFMEVNKEF